MKFKRLTILSGHYGSGKTNIAVNIAVRLAGEGKKVTVADLDIVNPYFRTKDSVKLFGEKGIRLISSDYAGSNLDIPALPQDMYALTDDKSSYGIIDVGGDDRGALALGRLVPAVTEENDYDMLMVVNSFRPLTRTAADTVEVMREIEAACGMKFTGIVNNSNLGAVTRPIDVISSMDYARETSALAGIPLKMVSCEMALASELEKHFKENGITVPILGMRLQKRPV